MPLEPSRQAASGLVRFTSNRAFVPVALSVPLNMTVGRVDASHVEHQRRVVQGNLRVLCGAIEVDAAGGDGRVGIHGGGAIELDESGAGVRAPKERRCAVEFQLGSVGHHDFSGRFERCRIVHASNAGTNDHCSGHLQRWIDDRIAVGRVSARRVNAERAQTGKRRHGCADLIHFQVAVQTPPGYHRKRAAIGDDAVEAVVRRRFNDRRCDRKQQSLVDDDLRIPADSVEIGLGRADERVEEGDVHIVFEDEPTAADQRGIDEVRLPHEAERIVSVVDFHFGISAERRGAAEHRVAVDEDRAVVDLHTRFRHRPRR